MQITQDHLKLWIFFLGTRLEATCVCKNDKLSYTMHSNLLQQTHTNLISLGPSLVKVWIEWAAIYNVHCLLRFGLARVHCMYVHNKVSGWLSIRTYVLPHANYSSLHTSKVFQDCYCAFVKRDWINKCILIEQKNVLPFIIQLKTNHFATYRQ